MSSAPRTGLSPENRNLVVVTAGVVAIVFAFVTSNVAANHEPEPHNLPVGIVGSPQVIDPVAGQLGRSAPGAFEVIPYSSVEAARTGILHRDVYGAFVPGPAPTLLVATAASRPAEDVLRQTFEAATRAQGQTLVVRDLAPLPASDSGGGRPHFPRSSASPSRGSWAPRSSTRSAGSGRCTCAWRRYSPWESAAD
jgi:hypothetical protein